MKATSEKKKRKKWPVVLAVILVMAAIGTFWNSQNPPAEPIPPSAPSEPAPPDDGPSAEDLYNDAEAKVEIQAAVEALVDNSYKGNSYSCDVLTRTDGAGYIVAMQINVDVVPPESTEIISGLETAIQGLGYRQIAEIQIMAFKETQKEIGLVDSNMDLDPSMYKIPAE